MNFFIHLYEGNTAWHVCFLFRQDIIATGRHHWVYTSVGSNGIVLVKCLWLTCVNVLGVGIEVNLGACCKPPGLTLHISLKRKPDRLPSIIFRSAMLNFTCHVILWKNMGFLHARKISEVWYGPVTSQHLGTGDVFSVMPMLEDHPS